MSFTNTSIDCFASLVINLTPVDASLQLTLINIVMVRTLNIFHFENYKGLKLSKNYSRFYTLSSCVFIAFMAAGICESKSFHRASMEIFPYSESFQR